VAQITACTGRIQTRIYKKKLMPFQNRMRMPKMQTMHKMHCL